MSILQWNIQSIRSNFEELKDLMSTHNPICVCLQETLLGNHPMNPPSRYSVIQSKPSRYDGHDRGVALLINKATPSKLIILNTDLQAVAARVWMGRWYSVCCLYLPHIPVTQRQIENVLDQLPAPYLLLGDMNARSQMRGEDVTNDKGRLFNNLLLTPKLTLLNGPEPTYFHIQTNSYTKIDLSLSSPDCMLDFTHSVLDSLHGSDHFPIILERNAGCNFYLPLPKYKIEKADWSAFCQLTGSVPDSAAEDIDCQIDALCNVLLSSADQTIPKKNPLRTKIPVPWWNAACQSAKVQRRRAERALKRTYSIANKIAYNRLRALCRKTYKEARRNCWFKYVSSINVSDISEPGVQEGTEALRQILTNYPSPSK